jgi:hypothetical protein
MGATYRNIKGSVILTNSTVVTGSVLNHAMNSVAGGEGGDTAKALALLAQVVHDAGNRDAGQVLDAFNKELADQQPRKPLLRAFWDSLVKLVPAVVAVKEIIEKVVPLFT